MYPEVVSFSNLLDIKEKHMKKVRRTSNAERRIHELTVNMRMKEELIKELDRTGVFKWFYCTTCREIDQIVVISLE